LPRTKASDAARKDLSAMANSKPAARRVSKLTSARKRRPEAATCLEVLAASAASALSSRASVAFRPEASPSAARMASREEAIDFGLSGPNLRASGVNHDLRKQHPYMVYDQLDFDVPVGSNGDCYDRYLLRIEEMRQSVRLLEQCLEKLPGGPVNVPDMKIVLPPKDRVLTRMEELIHHFINVTQGVNAPPGEVYFAHENPKGELGFYIYSKGGGTPHRLKIRSPSFVNLSILSKLLPGHMVSDVVAILGSLDFVMGECDR